MKTTIEFLSAVKNKYDLPSDYALAGKLELSRASISRFMNGKDNLGDETAMRVADLLDLDPAHVVACIHAERAKTEKEKKMWERFATMTAGVSIAVLLALLFPAQDVDFNGLFLIGSISLSQPMYIMSNSIMLNWLLVSLLFTLMIMRFSPHTAHQKQ